MAQSSSPRRTREDIFHLAHGLRGIRECLTMCKTTKVVIIGTSSDCSEAS